jgi:hypothetical protein
MEGLDSGGQGPTSGCCAIEEEEEIYVVCMKCIKLTGEKEIMFFHTYLRKY